MSLTGGKCNTRRGHSIAKIFSWERRCNSGLLDEITRILTAQRAGLGLRFDVGNSTVETVVSDSLASTCQKNRGTGTAPHIEQSFYMETTVVIQGITRTASTHSVDETVDQLRNILQSRGVSLFALIDHSGEAKKVGMRMPPTKLLIFGKPEAGTPVMIAVPSSAIDLPLDPGV